MKQPNIILVGYMGCGKSTLGKQIANRLKIDFLDSDAYIESVLGITINEIFNCYGEQHFRNLERTFLNNLPRDRSYVLSCGGGMPCFKDNMNYLRSQGTVFYLKRSPKELLLRLEKGRAKRPLIAKLEPKKLLEFIEESLKEREFFYNQADFVLSRSEQNIAAIIEKSKLDKTSENFSRSSSKY
jgi:shikimate kinase